MPTELDLHSSRIEPGLTVIEASAGTGKTYSISHLVPRLLLEGVLLDLSKLLLVTFTKDAARELSDRVRRVLTQLAEPPTADELAGTDAIDIAQLRTRLEDPEANARLQRALLDLDLLSVSTIHAFCQRSLQQEGALCGLPVLPEVITDDSEYLDPIVRRHWVSTLSDSPVLAALATAQGWQLAKARDFINTLRRCLRPQAEPQATPYTQLLPQLQSLINQLQNQTLWASAPPALQRVSRWSKKGPANAEAAITQASAVLSGDPASVSFWQALERAAALPNHANKQGAANKEAAAALRETPWFLIAEKLQTLIRELEWSWQHHLAKLAVPELADFMARHRLITQDGLIGTLYYALHRSRGGETATEQSTRLANSLAERYHVALIDESQDTDSRQFAIFQRIFLDAEPRRRLILVGDPKQAIYGFRGADLSTYLAARDAAQATYTLSQTRRAPQPLVKVVNTLFDRPHSLLNPGMTFTPATSALDYDHQLFRDGQPCSRLEAWIVPEDSASDYSAQDRRTSAISARIADTIVDLLTHRAELIKTNLATHEITNRVTVTPAHFAVLVATHAQAAGMAAALDQRNVPAVINSGADVFASEEASDLHILLTALLNPRRTGHLNRALATRLLGLDANALISLEQPRAASATTINPPSDWLARFTSWHEAWQQRGLVELFTQLDKPANPDDPNDHGVTQRLALASLNGERRVTNYRQLTDLLLDAGREIAAQPDELVRWLGQQIAQASERSDAEERQLQLSSDREAVQVVTMHKAKGLEYPLVFCPYLADSLYAPRDYEKLPRTAGPTNPPSDTLLNLQLTTETDKESYHTQLISAQLEERLRLAYVAITRAQARAWIYCYRPSSRRDLGSPLDWLLRSDAEIIAHPTYSPAWLTLARSGGTDRHRATLEALGARPADDDRSDTQTGITFRAPPDVRHEIYRPAVASDTIRASGDTPLSALPAPVIPRSWRVTSFSTLTREQHAHGAPTTTPVSGEQLALPESTTPTTPPALAFIASPAGAAVGTAVHDWIETWDLSPLGPWTENGSALSAHFNTVRLPEPRPDQPAWPATLHELFSTLRLIQLPGCGETPLHTLCPDAHGSEWHFHLPLAGDLSVLKLADCFRQHAAPEHRAYAAQLATLSDEKFNGLLQGFIDRLVRHDDAWGVIDWKSNRLGATLADYDQPALLRCAMDSHYLLQAHLYLVALRRYLRALGPIDAPIAGAWLVFLRAIAPGSARGVLRILPPVEMLDALDALFAPAANPDFACT